MDMNRAFTTTFEDPKWATKAALGGVAGLLVITGPALYGYYLEYIRQVANGADQPLPEWNDPVRLWVRGLLFTVAMLIYMLPALILWGIGVLPLITTAIAGGEPGLGSAGSLCLFGVIGFIWAIGVSVLAYGAAVNYALRDSFGSLFAIGEILGRIRGVPGYLQAWLLSLVAFMAAGAIGGTITSVLSAVGLGLVSGFITGFTTFIAQVISGHLFGQWARAAYDLVPATGTTPPAATGYAPPPPPSGV